jgi:toxin secretion/phage lysis holin
MRKLIIPALSAITALIAQLIGGFDAGLLTLVTLMAIDYVSGLIVAGIFKKSPKTENGKLESNAGLKGICKKAMCLCVVVVGNQLDAFTQSNFIRDAIIIGFVANETISVIENAGLMGIPIPNVVAKAIDILDSKKLG